MPANRPVNLTIQTLFCLAPILDMYAAYKVKKLRKYLVIMILVSIPIAILQSILFPIDKSTFMQGMVFEHTVSVIIASAGTVLIAMYLVRRWSKQWNEQFDTDNDLNTFN